MRQAFSPKTEARKEIRGISGWELIYRYLEHIPESFVDEMQKCESEIERLMGMGLYLAGASLPPSMRPTIAAQVPIGKYRADLVVTGWQGAPRIVVECDGAEFHQDKAKDFKRTEAIEAYGYRVFRRTGSEIYNNPVAQAASVLREAKIIA